MSLAGFYFFNFYSLWAFAQLLAAFCAFRLIQLLLFGMIHGKYFRVTYVLAAWAVLVLLMHQIISHTHQNGQQLSFYNADSPISKYFLSWLAFDAGADHLEHYTQKHGPEYLLNPANKLLTFVSSIWVFISVKNTNRVSIHDVLRNSSSKRGPPC